MTDRLEYTRNPTIPTDSEGKDVYLADELDKVSFTIANLKTGGNPNVWSAVATATTGTIQGDVNAMDWTGNQHADETVLTALYIGQSDMVSFYNNSGQGYYWIGPKDVTVGVGGSYTTTAGDYSAITVSQDHPDLTGRSNPNQHPTSAITGLDAKQASQDTAIGNNASAILVHTENTTIHFPDADADGTVYGRQNNAWVEVTSGGGGNDFNYDEGGAATVYSLNQIIDGGNASTIYSPSQIIDCGDANG